MMLLLLLSAALANKSFCDRLSARLLPLANHNERNNIRPPIHHHWYHTRVFDNQSFWISLNDPNTDTYISGTLSHGHQWEPDIVSVLRRFIVVGDVFVDVGANIGYFSGVSALLGASEVHSFEPVPSNYERLNATRTRFLSSTHTHLDWHVYRAAVSSRSGDTVYLGTADARRNSGNYKVGHGDASHSAPTVTLDETIPSGKEIRVLKVDVEGHEARVLDGARTLICKRGVQVIILEVTNDLMSHKGCRWKDMFRWLISIGYTLETTQGSPIPTASWEPQIHWKPPASNLVFVRKNAHKEKVC